MTCVLVNLPPVNYLGVDACSRCGISCIRSNCQKEFYVHQCSLHHRYCPRPNCPNWLWFASRSQCNSKELGMMALRYIPVFSGHDTKAINNSPDILQKPSLFSIASQSTSDKSATPPSSCKESHPLRTAKVRPYASRDETIDSLVA